MQQFKGLKLTHITIPKGMPQKDIPAYVKAKLPLRFQGTDIKELLANPELKITVESPPLKQKIVTYASALKEWVAAGSPTRSSIEIKQILKICQACSAYNKGVCNSCGCRVTNSEWGILNKIRMKTQHCPRKKW